MAFHPEGDGKDTSAALNRKRKKQRVFRGDAHAALVFEGDDCIGWCQFGSPAELPRIKNRAAHEKTVTSLTDWRIACHYVAKGHRRSRVATAAFEGVLELITEMGGGVVEGYPEPAESVPAGFLFMGALSTFEQLGFQRDLKIDKHRWVVSRLLAPR